jgi:hypothetical protein
VFLKSLKKSNPALFQHLTQSDKSSLFQAVKSDQIDVAKLWKDLDATSVSQPTKEQAFYDLVFGNKTEAELDNKKFENKNYTDANKSTWTTVSDKWLQANKATIENRVGESIPGTWAKAAPAAQTGAMIGAHNKVAANANSAGVGEYVPGLGIKNMQGGFGKGPTQNAGGGTLDTTSGIDEKGNDIITQGPQSVNTATSKLRAHFQQAGPEELASHYQLQGETSDVIFESFSWVPDGYGLGPHNRLHLLNKQHDQLRYGMEPMMQPRTIDNKDLPFGTYVRDMEDIPLALIEEEYLRMYDKSKEEQDTLEFTEQYPPKRMDIEYNTFESIKQLPKPDRPHLTESIYRNTEDMFPVTDPEGKYLNTPNFNTTSSTNQYKQLVFNSQFS